MDKTLVTSNVVNNKIENREKWNSDHIKFSLV